MLLITFITLTLLCQHCDSRKKTLERLIQCQKGGLFCGDPLWQGQQDEDNNGEAMLNDNENNTDQ